MSLFSTLNISGSGLSAQRQRVEIVTQNLANAETTSTPEGGPYQRRHVVFSSDRAVVSPFSSLFSAASARLGVNSLFGLNDAQGVRVSEIVRDESPPELRYEPGHPDAGPDGYVAYPSFRPVEELTDLMSSVRSYQANLSAVSAVKDMIQRTLEISRG